MDGSRGEGTIQSTTPPPRLLRDVELQSSRSELSVSDIFVVEHRVSSLLFTANTQSQCAVCPQHGSNSAC